MQIQFLGATQEVTGSCHLVEINSKKFLLDCGLIQGNHDSEQRNTKPFDFKANDIDAVILSHAHLDHSGRLPLLIKAGFRGTIFTHHATVDLCKILLEDAGYLNERNAEWENKKRQRQGQGLIEPLYTQNDAKKCMDYFLGIEYQTPTEILPGVELTLHDAGHILGSAIVDVTLTEGKNKRKIIFSGDLGHTGAPILKNPTPLHNADLVIMESTYGDRIHRNWESTWQELGETIQNARNDKGNVLIPAFTVGRTQELLYEFSRHYEEWGLNNWQIFLDSPMAIETTQVYTNHSSIYDRRTKVRLEKYGNPFNLPNLHLTRTTEESMALNKIHSGAIIIAGSGMCTGGRIKQHFKHNIWKKHCHVIIVGFQARGTTGRALIDGAHNINLWGENVVVNAKIHNISGLSAHADQEGLIKWYQQFSDTPQLCLVHGEEEAQKILADKIKEKTNVSVMIPHYGETLNLLSL